MGAAEHLAWSLSGDLLLDDPREGDEWGLAREALALFILENLNHGREPMRGVESFMATL